MRTFLTYCFLLLTLLVSGQTIKLTYEPKGKIVRFYFDSLIIDTDTTSLFLIYDEKGAWKEYHMRVKRLVNRQFLHNNVDTAFFSGNFIPFSDSIDNKYQKDWYVEWAILKLTRANRIIIYDKHGQLVEKILIKKIGTKKEGYVRRAFINKRTKEELFSELEFASGYTPAF